jgi:PAS domain S-box-containing protein
MRGERPGPELIVQDASVNMFDARELERWGIGERRLPSGSIVQFRSPSAWQRYKWPIVGATALIALQTMLAAGLLLERRRRRRVQRGLDERLRFESLLAELSARFTVIAPEEVDRQIESALVRIIETLGLDRVILARFTDNGAQLSLTHTAMHGGGRALLPVAAAERFPWTAERLRQGHIVRFSRLDELPSDAVEDRESFRALGTRSIIIVPLVIGTSVMGGLGFTSLHSERGWPEESAQRLRLLGELFATALARKQAEITLRESEERLVLMMEASPSMISMSGVDARCTYFNTRWLELTGRKLEQELGDGWAEGIHPEDLEQCLDEYRRAFAAREPFTLEYRLRRADGEYRWLLDHGVPRIEASGEFRGYMSSCIDVTDIRAARQVLLEHTALRSAVFSSLYGQLAAVDRDGVILTVNESWSQGAREHGADPARSSVGVNYLAVCRQAAAAGDEHAKPMFDAIESVLDGRATRASLEYPVSMPEGDRWFEMVVEPFRRPEGGAIVSHIEITRRRRAEEEARHQREELAHALRTATMGELAASLAHEINQPLTAILANAQAARRLLAAPRHDHEDLQEALADIGEDARRAAQIIGRLRALVRKQDTQPEPVDLNAIAMGVAALLRHDLRRKGIAVTFDLSQSLPPVPTDSVQLQQVVLNLLVNASDAVVAGGDTRREITVVTVSNGDGSVELSVSDTGGGMLASELERIFAPFVSTKPQGLGLGLAIGRSIVSAHGGRMWATRNADQGLTVHRGSRPSDRVPIPRPTPCPGSARAGRRWDLVRTRTATRSHRRLSGSVS